MNAAPPPSDAHLRQYPLVSLIVRTMGRPELSEALQSVTQQTYPSIEVIVVDARGGGDLALVDRCGAFPLRVVSLGIRLLRPAAANAGFNAAQGVLLGLLDDDDLLDPSHIAYLVSAMEAQPQYIAAYSDVRDIDNQGEVMRHRAQTYSRFLLFQECYIHPNSLLFRRHALSQCHFDERLEICEDWDFWLQLSALADFLHVPNETAICRPTIGTSGAGQGVNRDEARFRHYVGLLSQKWAAVGQSIAVSLDDAVSRGAAAAAQGRRDEAESAVDSVLKQYPFHVEALNLRGRLHTLRNEHAAAASCFRVGVQEAPNDPRLRCNLAQALDRLGQSEEAAAEYRKVLIQTPTHTYAQARLTEIERRLRAKS